MCATSTGGPGVVEFIASLEASPVSISRTQGSGQASMENEAGFGRSSLESWAKYDPDTCSLRTLQPSLFGASTESSPTLPRSGTMRNGVVSARPKSALRRNGNGFSSWPTQQAHDAQGPKTPAQIASARARGAGVRNLNETAAYWPTPDDALKFSAGNRKTDDLAQQAKLWPTTTTTDHKGSSMPGQRRGQLSEAAEMRWPSPTSMDSVSSGSANYEKTLTHNPGTTLTDVAVRRSHSGHHVQTTPMNGDTSSTDGQTSRHRHQLNPRFVEHLQAWPLGWTDYAPLGTEFTSWRQRMRSWLSQLGYRMEHDQ